MTVECPTCCRPTEVEGNLSLFAEADQVCPHCEAQNSGGDWYLPEVELCLCDYLYAERFTDAYYASDCDQP